MNRYLVSLFAAGALVTPAFATLSTWQAAVGTGTAPAATVFTPTNGAAPAVVNVGTLSGDRSFEFIYNAGVGGASQALMGSQDPVSGVQGLKADQWNATGFFGMTDFGVADYTSSAAMIRNADTRVVYSSNGVDTLLYVNGAQVFTFAGVDLTMTGLNAIGAASTPGHAAFFDNLAGTVLGFASYDSALSAAEVSAHFNAFVIPEPTVTGLALLAGMAALRRRRK